jgi:hypothetical protein
MYGRTARRCISLVPTKGPDKVYARDNGLNAIRLYYAFRSIGEDGIGIAILELRLYICHARLVRYYFYHPERIAPRNIFGTT